MQEICRIGQDFYTFHSLHELLPYPLVDMCRKCEECHVLENRTCRKSYLERERTRNYEIHGHINSNVKCFKAVLHNIILCRKKSDSVAKDLDVSTNVAYKEVNLKAKESTSDYENVEVILQSSSQLTDENDKTRARSFKFGTSKSEASEYVDRAYAM